VYRHLNGLAQWFKQHVCHPLTECLTEGLIPFYDDMENVIRNSSGVEPQEENIELTSSSPPVAVFNHHKPALKAYLK